MAKKFFVLQHVACEPLGIWEEELNRWHARFETVKLWEGDKVPVASETLAAIVLGGPMNVDETDQFPFLEDEVAYIKALIEADIHVLGVCLGSQLMAKALGGRVSKGPKSEIGYSNVTLTPNGADNRLFRGFPMTLPVFQWHSQGFELPQGVEHLATSEDFPNQAFAFQHAWGLQFHAEVTSEQVESMAKAYEEELAVQPGVTRTKLKEQALAQGQMVALYGRQIIRRFWDSVTEI